MAKRVPLVRGNTLTYQHDEQERVLLVETPAWQSWLETASTFTFTSEAGTFTARKERAGNRRGGWYWKAYRTQHGKLTSHYLGKAETLTLAHLLEVAQTFATAHGGAPPGRGTEAAVPSAHGAGGGVQHSALPLLLATKLYRPRQRAHLVRRRRLTARLTQGAAGPLTLVSAPAGFGKTTLLAQWLAESDSPAAWLSLDNEENDPTRFLAYLIAAVQTLVPNIGAGVVGLLQSPQPPPITAVLTALLNDLTTLPDPFILILDDYHLIEAQAVNQALAYLVEHLPPQMHLVVATREDPQLPLARLRARGQVTELRAADLRFTPAEAADFLTQVMGLPLSAEDIALLSGRTEGWIAGLQLAALSLQGQPDRTRFIQSFTGSHQFVLDYLVEEVLHQQPQRLQTFLLRTSILERLCGPLCEAVVLDPATPGQATLEALDRANLFLVPLDNERRWYRYHHLFAEVLRQRLHLRAVSAPGDTESQVVELHLRASQWYEDHSLELEAFQHAAAAQDVERCERLIEGRGMPLHFRGAVTPVLHWLESLPPASLDARPALWTAYASTLLVTGQLTDAEQKLQAAEAALEGAAPDSNTKDLIGRIAASRATAATNQKQVDTIIAQSRRALQYLHPNNLAFRTSTAWKLGYAYQLQGDRAAARQAYTEVIALGEASGNTIYTLMATTGLGNIQEGDNQLHLAAQTYRRAVKLLGDQPLPILCEAHLGLARICYEWNNLEAAAQHAQQSLPLARQIEHNDRFVACEVLLARLKLAQGDVAGAAAKLSEASQFARQNTLLSCLPGIAAAQVLTFLRRGQLEAAARLATTHDLPLSRARVHLAQGDPSAALTVLVPWREQMEARGWADARLMALVLEAVALQAQGEGDQAVQVLLDALALAAPSGFLRLFVDEGAPMSHLLAAAAAQGMMLDYIAKVMAACEAEEHKSASSLYLSAPAQPLIERLSRREVEVLRLVAQGCSNQEIARRLVLALSTVKGHNQHICAKLHVERRTEAVARARALNLL
jgi:ATP/maltotriose-dependent transcriptional regulator MalT